VCIQGKLSHEAVKAAKAGTKTKAALEECEDLREALRRADLDMKDS
jgi:hypothetical protein